MNKQVDPIELAARQTGRSNRPRKRTEEATNTLKPSTEHSHT